MCDLLDKKIEELTNQKEIEEMARKIDYAINNECKLNNGKTCEECLFDNKGDWKCQSKMIESHLYGEGYRQVKDKVVLTKEEYERLSIFQFTTAQQIMSETRKEMQAELRQASELKAETIRLVKQEMAKEIISKAKDLCKELENKYSHLCKSKKECMQETCRYEGVLAVKRGIYELAKEYGVEVE